jgi:hypothetical protein
MQGSMASYSPTIMNVQNANSRWRHLSLFALLLAGSTDAQYAGRVAAGKRALNGDVGKPPATPGGV